MIVELFTANGSFVHREEVLPPLSPPPEVICWRNRAFILDSRSYGLKYRECFWILLLNKTDKTATRGDAA